MALICPVCSTENRDGAHFCRSCGVKLSATADRIPPPPSPEREWATTAPAQLRAPTIPAPLFDPGEPTPAPAPAPARSFFGRASAVPRDDEQTVFMVHDDDEQPYPQAPRAVSPTFESEQAAKAERHKARAKTRRPATVEQPPRKRVILLWLGLLVVAVAMLVAGWYGYGTRKTPTAAEEAVQPVEAAARAAPAASAVPVAVPAPAPAVEPAPAPAEPAEAPPAAEASSAATAATAKPVAKPRKQATVAAPVPSAPEPAAPVVAAAPPPLPAAAAPAEPQAQCGDRNFIAKAQCMAAQCLKPEYKAHAQCDAVRRQQRLEEEKRNPTLVN